MIFTEEIVLSCLEKKGFSSLCLVRSVKGCRWYEGKNEGQFYEIEVYSPEFLADPDLQKYLESLKFMVDDLNFLRRPTHIYEKRNYTFVFRKGKGFEPLTDYFLRHGAISGERGEAILQSFEKILEYLTNNPMGNFSPLAVLFRVSESDQVYLDSFRCGPWIKNYPEINVIYRYLNIELDWEGQLHFFKNKLSLKLFLGSVDSYEIAKDFKNLAVRQYLAAILADEVGFKGSISDFERGQAAKSHFKFWGMVAGALMLFFLLNFFLRCVQPEKNWQGLTGNESTVDQLIFDEVNERAVHQVNQENFAAHQYEFEEGFKKVSLQLALGQFNEVILSISYLKSLSLSESNREKLNDLQVKLPELIKKGHAEIINLVEALVQEKNYDAAFELVSRHQVNYPESFERKQLLALLVRIESERKLVESDSNISKKADWILHDRNLIEKSTDILNSPLSRPLRELALRKRQLSLVREELKTSAAKYLVDCWQEQLSAKKELLSKLINSSEPIQSRLFGKLQSLKAYDKLEFIGVSEKGFDYSDVTGGATLEFSKLAPNVMLKLFRELVSHESDDFHYQLFLYCLKNKLHSEAESELKKIAAIEILAAADRFKDMEDAQQDLWKPLGN